MITITSTFPRASWSANAGTFSSMVGSLFGKKDVLAFGPTKLSEPLSQNLQEVRHRYDGEKGDVIDLPCLLPPSQWYS